METNEISLHEVRVYLALIENGDRWVTNKDIAAKTADVAERTVRAHVLKLARLGLLDQAEVFPSHRYRWSKKAKSRNAGYELRLRTAAEVFGLPLT